MAEKALLCLCYKMLCFYVVHLYNPLNVTHVSVKEDEHVRLRDQSSR